MNPEAMKVCLPTAAFAFRGYNVTNLGRSRELLEHPEFGPIVEPFLREASDVCAESTHRAVNLVERVRREQETTIETYAEAAAIILAMEQAQIRLLEEVFEIPYGAARIAFGYSLGEAGALVASGMMSLRNILRTPLMLAQDCVDLAHDVTLAVLFSRDKALPMDRVQRLCARVNCELRGIMGISAFLSPNSVLLMGQGNTLDRFRELVKDEISVRVYLRKNEHQWPPLHTPIVWLRNIPSRAALLLYEVPGGFEPPVPPVLSLVTGKSSYNDHNLRDLLYAWTDHPQRLWDAVSETLAMGIETVIHVGPSPNIILATYARISENVVALTKSSLGMMALSAAASRPWLKALLPQRASLLRAPLLRHIVLEDWLLTHAPQVKTVVQGVTLAT